jgi:peroxin-5
MVKEFEDFEGDDQDVKPPDFDSMRQWLNQYENMDEAELEKEYEKAWQESALDEPSFSQERKDKLNRPYEFQKDNPFLQDPDSFQKGVEEFNRGSMRKAVLLLEAAVQQDATNARAWEYLGQAQAENDRDDLASLALLRAVQADPANRSALMTLAVSYTNDFHKDRALDCLHQWVASHPDYAAIADEPDAILTNDEDANQRIVTDMFIRAARMRIADPDPDVQTALGLLFNLSFEYDRAVDCFKAAVLKRPDDYLLWNKLGATQANGRRSEEAVDAYFRALEIKPVYTRARANLGISFLALNRYGDAAKAFLSALAINDDAEHIWGNLRTVFSLMQRPDLVDKCDARDVRAFSNEFNFG